MVSNPTGGSVSATGLYTAGNAAGTDVVALRDSNQCEVRATLEVPWTVTSGSTNFNYLTLDALDFSASPPLVSGGGYGAGDVWFQHNTIGPNSRPYFISTRRPTRRSA